MQGGSKNGLATPSLVFIQHVLAIPLQSVPAKNVVLRPGMKHFISIRGGEADEGASWNGSGLHGRLTQNGLVRKPNLQLPGQVPLAGERSSQ